MPLLVFGYLYRRINVIDSVMEVRNLFLDYWYLVVEVCNSL